MKLTAWLLVPAAAALAARPAEKEAPRTGTDLMREAHALAANWTPDDRVSILYRLANSAARRDRRLALEWAEEDFAAAQKTTGPDRAANEMNALLTLIPLDLEAAIRRFQDLDPPAGKASEDDRDGAADALFPALLSAHRPDALEFIQRWAMSLGTTGVYPFLAVAAVIEQIGPRQPDQAALLARQAIDAFELKPQFPDTPIVFLAFLQKARPFLKPETLRAGLEKAVQAAESKHLDDGIDPKTKLVIEFRWDGKSVRLASNSEALLYRLLPLVEESDPEWANRLREHHAALKFLPVLPAGGQYQVVGAIARPGSQDPAAINRALEGRKVTLAAQAAAEDYGKARSLVDSISTPELRALGRASILPKTMEKDPEAGREEYNDLKKRLEAEQPTLDTLRLETALLGSLSALHRDDDVRFYLARAYSLGEELFSEDSLANPTKGLLGLAGFDELNRLTMALGRRENPEALARIRRVHDARLRAHLLVSYADGSLAADPRQ